MPELASSWRAPFLTWDRIRQYDSPRHRALRARAATDERRHGAQHVARRVEKRAVDPESASTITDHDGAITRETQRRHAAQAVQCEEPEQLVASTGREDQLELRYRATHCAGPGSKARPSQMSVWTSTFSRVIVQTFTDCGRCPRDRLETVPATEINMRPSVTIASW